MLLPSLPPLLIPRPPLLGFGDSLGALVKKEEERGGEEEEHGGGGGGPFPPYPPEVPKRKRKKKSIWEHLSLAGPFHQSSQVTRPSPAQPTQPTSDSKGIRTGREGGRDRTERERRRIGNYNGGLTKTESRKENTTHSVKAFALLAQK